MTKLTNIFSSLALLAIGGFIFASCTQSTTSTTTNPPSNLTATATSAFTINVSWTRDPNDASADTIQATASDGSTVSSVQVPSPGSNGTLTGLKTGVHYTVSVRSSGGTSSSITLMTDAPSGLQVLSVDAATIRVKWTRTEGDASPDTIIATSAGNSPIVFTDLAPNAGPTDLTSLSKNTVYSISIHSTSGSTDQFQWETADRTTGLKIYETSDPSATDPSALVLGTTSTAKLLSGLGNADFVLQTFSGAEAGITLETGALFKSHPWHLNLIDSIPNYIVGGLNANYRSTNYQANQARAHSTEFDLNDSTVYATKGSRVLIVNTDDGHLALVEIVPDATTGKLYSTTNTTPSYKYITVNVSYQSEINQPYAGRGRSHNSSGPVARISAK